MLVDTLQQRRSDASAQTRKTFEKPRTCFLTKKRGGAKNLRIKIYVSPWKMNGWNITPWRLEDHFPF